MDIYTSVGYGEREAAFEIVEHNLHGLDIDKRAYQLAYFAVMMKGRQYNRRFFRGKDGMLPKPKVYAFSESNAINRAHLKYFGADLNELEKGNALNQMNGLLDTFKDAREYGSILNVDDCDWALLRSFIQHDNVPDQLTLDVVGIEKTKKDITMLIDIGIVMTKKYDAVVTNPPYMGASGMDMLLLEFIKNTYPVSKSDFSTVFMEKALALSGTRGYIAMINIPVWMFISSYKQLRKKLLNDSCFISLLHFGRGIFGADFGSTAFILSNQSSEKHIGTYMRLFDRQSAVDSVETKEKWFFERKGSYKTEQDRFKNLDNYAIAYWFPENLFSYFKSSKIGNIGVASEGVKTGNNEKFLRLLLRLIGQENGIHIRKVETIENGTETMIGL